MQVVALIDEEKGKFGVTFPDFPGCTTVGGSLEEAVAKAGEVLAFHAEGLAEDGDLPQPRSLGELGRDQQFRKDAAGSLLVLVPYAPPARALRINITMDESLLARIDRAAEVVGESRSGYLAEAAKQRLGVTAGARLSEKSGVANRNAKSEVFHNVARTRPRKIISAKRKR